MLTEELIEKALKGASGRRITDVRAGLGYTCVLLDDDSCGLAYTFRNELGGCCGTLGEAGGLIGKGVAEVIPWLQNRNLLKAAIGTAAANAVFNTARTDWDTGNVTSALEVGPADTFGMVGHFGPILAEIKKKTENIYVFEQDVPAESPLYPADAAAEYLPKCDVVVVTATSVINHTFDALIPHCRKARQICLVGPSTPLCPEALARYGVTLLAGSVVTDPERILRIVSQGGGTMSMKPAIRQVLVRI
jgi:uncharacterized protein (DUF4213/DUF364 family)